MHERYPPKPPRRKTTLARLTPMPPPETPCFHCRHMTRYDARTDVAHCPNRPTGTASGLSGCPQWEREPGIDDEPWPATDPYPPPLPPPPRQPDREGWWSEPRRAPGPPAPPPPPPPPRFPLRLPPAFAYFMTCED